MKYLITIFLVFITSCSSDKKINRDISSKRAVTDHIVAGFGNIECLADGKQSDIDNLNIDLKGAKRSEKRFVRDIVSSIRDLAGEQQSKVLIGKMKIKFENYLRMRSDGNCLPGNFGLTTRGTIDLARRCHPKSAQKNLKFDGDHLRGSLIHEIGHVVGNRRYQGKSFYDHYSNNVKRVCKVSTYTTQSMAGNKHPNRNEEFAEVWAAYIYATDRLKRKCRKAYNFMRETVFSNASHSCKSLR